MAAKFLPYLLAGISVGGQYALIAIGYTMVYGILRLINFAHGDIFTVAGFLMVYATASLPLTISIPLVVVLALDNLSFVPSMLLTVLRKGAIYALVAVSMNLLNGFTGLFSLGQAGFMLLGAYTYAILTIPAASQKSIYQRYANGGIGFSIPELLSKPLGGFGLLLGVVFCLILAGFIAALFAFLIGLPVLKLKSDYLAIATLGFAEIIRAAVVYEGFGPLTNGSNLLYGFTSFASFNLSLGGTTLHLETVMPFLFSGICIAIILLLINSTYGRAFKAIRDDEIAAEAMGINLASHKRMSFIISSFFAGISGAMLAMYQASVQATTFKSSMTYEIRHWLGVRFHHRVLPVHRQLRMAAALPRQRDLDRRLPCAAAAFRLPHGGVQHHHYGGGAVLPQGHHGRP